MMRLQAQRGSALFFSLILLVVMSLFALTAFNSSNANLKVVGNAQVRQEALSVAQQAVEQTISSSLFTTNPQGVAASPVAVDVDGDGNVDYTARLTPRPSCYRKRAIKTSELDVALAADLQCMQSGVASNTGLDTADAGANAGDSLCASSDWQIRAQVDDTRTGASVAVNQGVAVRVLVTDAANSCQ